MNSHHLLLVASRLRSLARSLRRCGVVSATIDDATALVHRTRSPAPDPRPALARRTPRRDGDRGMMI